MEQLEELFFIYDTEAMQSEYDTIEESLLFLQPKIIIDEEEFVLLVGQLVGIVAFTEDLSGSVPSILRLEKMKFAILKCQSYLLFFGTSSNTLPDVSLKNRLKRLVSMITFFHGSFARLKQENGDDKDQLMDKLQVACECYLPFVKSYNSTLNGIFKPIPTFEFNKASYVIFMKANEMLESCQRRENVLCGALFSEDRLVTSQLPSMTILDILTLLKPNQHNLPADEFFPGFDCPYGIKIFKVYVTDKQYRKLMSAACLSPYKKKTNSEKNNGSFLTSCKRVTRLPLPNQGQSNKNSLRAGHSKESLLFEGSFESSYSDSLGASSGQFSNSTTSLNDCDDETQGKQAAGISLAKELSRIDLDQNQISKRRDLPIFRSSVPECTSERKDKSVPQSLDGIHQLHLYVQGHSSTLLVLLMEPKQSYHHKRLKSLWETVLPQLGDIEAQIKSLISSQQQKGSEATDMLRYLHFDKKQHTIVSSNMADPIDARDFASLEAINRIHDQFQMLPTLRDITIRSSGTSVCGHQSDSQEIFYEQRGNYQPIQGPPSSSDVTWTFDQRIRSSKVKQLIKSNIVL